MAPKKKKKKGKKKKKEYDPPVYQIPIYEDPELVTPKVELTIRHAEMEIPNDAMTLKLTFLITTKIGRVAKAISKHHQESITDVIICHDKYDPLEALNHEMTLEKCGISGPEANLYYDYLPFSYPLIGWPYSSTFRQLAKKTR